MRRRMVRIAVAASCLLMFGGCSGGDGDDSDEPADRRAEADTSEGGSPSDASMASDSSSEEAGESLDNETCSECCDALGFNGKGNARSQSGCKCIGVSGSGIFQEPISAEKCREALPSSTDAGMEAGMDAGMEAGMDTGGTDGGTSPSSLVWTRSLETSYKDIVRSVTMDGQGGIYVAGETDGDLGGRSNNGGTDGFVARYDASGSRQWVTLVGTSGTDRIHSVMSDGEGGFYVAGRTWGDLGGQNPDEGIDGFVARYDSNDTRRWVKTLGKTVFSVTMDGQGGIYVAGEVGGGRGIGDESNSGKLDGFVARYDSSGSRQWVRLLGTSKNDETYSVAADGEGSLYMVGRTEAGLGDQSYNGGVGDGYVAKYDASGSRKWVKLLGTREYDAARSVTYGQGEIYVAGAIDDYGLLEKYSPNGDLDWSEDFGSPEAFPGSVARSSTMDDQGNVYVVGEADGRLGDQSYNGGKYDVFVARYEGSGTTTYRTGDREWLRLFGTSKEEIAHSVTTDGNGNLYVGGRIGGKKYEENLKDGFIQKWNPDSSSP